MKIATIDFQKVLSEYKPYKDSMDNLELIKSEFSSSMEDIKTEMGNIVNTSKSLLLDDKTKSDNIKRMRDLQSKASESEVEFRKKFEDMRSVEMDRNFKEISDIISRLVKKIDGLDFVLDKNSVIFHKPELEITDYVVGEILKLDTSTNPPIDTQ